MPQEETETQADVPVNTQYGRACRGTILCFWCRKNFALVPPQRGTCKKEEIEEMTGKLREALQQLS